MADTSLTSLSDDLKDRLSLICRQDRSTGELDYDIISDAYIVYMFYVSIISPLTDPSSHLQREEEKLLHHDNVIVC